MPPFVQSLEPRQLCAAGSLDLSYGVAGVGKDVLPVGALVVHDKAVESGDRLLVAGSFQPVGGDVQNFLARYAANGKRDTKFAGTANVTSDPRGLHSIDLIATQADGKILLLDRNAGAGMFQIIRLSPKGNLDSSFGVNGVAKASVGVAREMIVADNGRIVVAGDSGTKIQVARFSANGVLEVTFGKNGIVSSQMNLAGTNSANVTYTRTTTSVAQMTDGRVVIAGTFTLNETNPSSTFSHPFVVRLSAAGKLDGSFNGNGTLQINNHGDANTQGLAVLSSGRVLVAAGSKASSSLLRFTSSGASDTLFGTNGVTALSGASKGILLQPDGKILVSMPSEFDRFEGNGTADATFTDGNVPNSEDLAGLGSDGSILSFSVGHKAVSTGPQFNIRPVRRWRELAPAGLLAAPDIAAAPTGTYRFSIQWRAELGVMVSSLASASIQVVGPSGAVYKTQFVNTNEVGDGVVRTGNYKFAPPGGTWDTSDNGTYTVRLLDGFIKDTQGHAASGYTLGTFQVILS